MIGIDAKISDIETVFKAKLFLTKNYSTFGRAFLNSRNGTIIPEILASGNEYQEVTLNDALDAQSFCIVEDDYTVEKGSRDIFSSKVSFYFSVNLSVCYPTITERAVEYVHRDISAILKYSDFNLESITQNWKEFQGAFDNMQPFYLVKFTTNIIWKNC